MRILSGLALVLMAAAVTAGPWLFGAWEPWWFWPLAALLFLASILFGVTLMRGDETIGGFSERLLRRDVAPLLVGCGLYLAYATVRMFLAPVYTDAERSLLLFLLPLFTAAIAAFTDGAGGRRILFYLLAVNILALGIYGLVNHAVTGSERVMWMPGFFQYIKDDRASGSYYCPNHFAGVLELGAALALGLLTDRSVKPGGRVLAALLLAVAVAGVVLSKSRGGGLVLLAVILLGGFTGLVQWQPRRRWLVRGAICLGGLAVAAVVAWQAHDYMGRFKAYPWASLERSDRVEMVKGSLRAWRTAPVFGVGPGMHQNLWPHFAASPDGDRATATWPSRPNVGWHSYETHSDWVQLLEEYGAVGLVLMLMATGLLVRLLWRGLRREEEDWRAAGWERPPRPRFTAVITAGWLAAFAMILHEAGDFNLQMPATGWLFGAILGLALSESARASDQ